MQLVKGTLSAAVSNLVQKPLGNAAKNEAVAQLANIFGELNGDINNTGIDPILAEIQKQLQNDPLYLKFQAHIILELQNFFYPKWHNDTRVLVAKSIAEVLNGYSKLVVGSYRGWVVDDSMHNDQMITAVFEISTAVKKAIRNESQDAFLLEAINEGNPKKVCLCIAAGADASKFVHLTLADPEKTPLLIFLLRAGSNPSDVFQIRDVGKSFAEGKNSLGKALATPFRAGAKLASEVSKQGFNFVSYAAACKNIAAIDILLNANNAIYYPKQLEDALQDQIAIGTTYKGGSALTVALMNRNSDVSRAIAVLLLRAGSHLSVVKGGLNDDYPDYNNLQLIVKFKLQDALMEALNFENKPKSYSLDLLRAVKHASTRKLSKSHYLVRALLEKYLPDMLKTFDAVMREVEKKTQDISFRGASELPKGGVQNSNHDVVVVVPAQDVDEDVVDESRDQQNDPVEAEAGAEENAGVVDAVTGYLANKLLGWLAPAYDSGDEAPEDTETNKPSV